MAILSIQSVRTMHSLHLSTHSRLTALNQSNSRLSGAQQPNYPRLRMYDPRNTLEKLLLHCHIIEIIQKTVKLRQFCAKEPLINECCCI